MQSIKLAKRQLRKSMSHRLQHLTQDQLRRESEQVLQRVQALPEFQQAQHLAIYISMAEGELQTRALLRTVLQTNRSLYVPRCDGKAMEMVPIPDQRVLDTLPVNRWGIPEPLPECPTVDPALLDFILVPGVAFDRHNNRCGHGKGYYDRYLERATSAYACGAGLPLQMVEQVPVAEHDKTLDHIITN